MISVAGRGSPLSIVAVPRSSVVLPSISSCAHLGGLSGVFGSAAFGGFACELAYVADVVESVAAGFELGFALGFGELCGWFDRGEEPAVGVAPVGGEFGGAE